MSLKCVVEYKGDYFATVLTIHNDKCIEINSAGTAVQIQTQGGATRIYPLDAIHCITTTRTGT